MIWLKTCNSLNVILSTQRSVRGRRISTGFFPFRVRMTVWSLSIFMLGLALPMMAQDEPPPQEPPPENLPQEEMPQENQNPPPVEPQEAAPVEPVQPPPVEQPTTPGTTPSSSQPSQASEEPQADSVPPGQELVNIDFPEPTEIKDIIRAVALWTGKNVILGRDVTGRVQMISPRKVTKEEAYQMFLSALNLLGLTTVETGKVIKILPVRSAVKGNLKTFLGSSWTPMTDEIITQIVPLKYINAKEVQTTLSRIVSSNSMIPYEPTNTLIISDSGFKVRRILDIVEMLDVQTQQPQVAIVPIRYADAKDIADKVTEIFRASAANKDKASSYLQYKILTDDRTNSVIIFGPPRTIADVKALVKKFDTETDDPSRQSTIHVRPLDYADAKKLATTLSTLATSGKNRRLAPRPPPTGDPGGQLSGPTVASLDDDVKITADESSNALLITGSRSAYESVNTLVRKLDIRRSQVFVEAEILDLKMDGTFGFGTSIFAGTGHKGNKIAYTWEAGTLGPVIVSQAAGSASQQNVQGAVSTFEKDLTIGVLSGQTIDIPGIGKVSPGALIKMIKTDATTKVLSSPHILTANNETAKFTVGQVLYYKNEQQSATGAVSSRFDKEPVDLTLEIKPNISHSNYVTMKIDLIANTGTIDNVSQRPSVNKRQANQIITVKNSQTVVISGLMQTSQLETYRKIPLLGDIPILGWLFRNSSISNERTSLLIFLTPHIIHGANDLAAIYEMKLRERDEFLSKMFGSDYEEEDFYAMLPKKEDGVYKEDELDQLEERNRQERLKQMRQDMGYFGEDIKKPEEKKDESLTVPGAVIEDKAGAGTEVQPIPPQEPIRQPEPEPEAIPEPVPPPVEQPKQPAPQQGQPPDVEPEEFQ